MHEDELEAHIQDCGRLMVQAYELWIVYGNFADRADADRWRMEMETAIKMRGPTTVLRLERERGLSGR